VISEITEALTQLLGRDVKLASGKGPEPTELVIRYVDGEGDLISAWTIERHLAFSLGAALTMVPRAIVEQSLQGGDDQAQLKENFHEVCNVLATTAANLLNRRSKLESVSPDRQELLRTARQIRANGGHWSVFELAIDGYAGGRMAVSFAHPDEQPPD